MNEKVINLALMTSISLFLSVKWRSLLNVHSRQRLEINSSKTENTFTFLEEK